jgi:protein-S-isoprenylcysteine O-methyltransferase Ste14
MIFAWEDPIRPIQYGMIVLGAVLLLTAARHYSMLQFLGLKQIAQEKSGKGMIGSGGLDTSGILGVVRHPWYSGVFLLIWAHDISLSELFINLILSAYLIIGTILEERKLILEFGEKYREYQRQVSMFIPIKWLRSKLHTWKLKLYRPAAGSP